MKRIFKIFNYFFIGFSYLANKKIIVILIVCLFMSLLKVSMAYKEELIFQEQKWYYDKGNPNIEYYNDGNFKVEYFGDTAINRMLACYNEGIDKDNISIEIKGYIDKLNKMYNSNEEYFSFFYQDLSTGFTVSYNENTPIFTASTIKAPAMIYLYEMASLGKIDLNERLVYTKNFYTGGSGVLQNKPVNTSYTVEELIQYSIHDSDNIAYTMLMNRFKRENVLAFWKKLNTSHIFTYDTIWGITSAKDASIYMKELYRFSNENKEYGSKLLDYFKKAEWKLITDKDGKFNTADKGGWSGKAIHDAAIVFDENPYILIIMSNTGEGGYMPLFQETSKMVGSMHEEYWKYKEKTCGSIKLY